MAVVIPFIASAMGASAVVSTVIAVGFAVTGISEKINKAASSVFGEDLVKIGNIAGMAYGAFNGGFGIGDTPAPGFFPDPSAGDYSAIGAGTVASDSAAQISQATSSLSNNDFTSYLGSASEAVSPAAASTFNLADMAKSPTDGFLDSFKESAKVKPITDVATTKPSTQSPFPDTTQAPTANAGVTADVKPITATASAPAPAAPGFKVPTGIADSLAAKPDESFIDKLIRMASDKDGKLKPEAVKFGGDAIMGLGAGYSSAQDREMRSQEMAKRDQETARANARRNIGLNGWRRTA